MSIPIPISKKYTATSRQGTIKQVACEKCSHEYAYEMIRSAQGSSSTFVFIPGEGTKNLAADRAHQKASKMLEKQCDPVPCPECGHVQAQMIPHYRRQQLAGMRVFAYLLMILAFILMWVLASDGYYSDGFYSRGRQVAAHPSMPFRVRLCVTERSAVLTGPSETRPF